MSKQKRGRRQVRFLRAGIVQLAPARMSHTPFCAYYGPKGETCPQTVGLKTVWKLPGPPTCIYMACPLHYEAVSQQVRDFLARLASSFQYDTLYDS